MRKSFAIATLLIAAASFSLFASCKKNKDVNVSFDLNYAATAPADFGRTVGKAYGNLPIVARPGYKFEGWFTEKTNGKKITSQTIVKEKEDHTLYAQWKNFNITVAIERNGGIGGKENEFAVDSGFVYEKLPTLSKDDYLFMGWYCSKQFADGTKIDNQTVVESFEDHTVYAKWQLIDEISEIDFDVYEHRYLITTNYPESENFSYETDDKGKTWLKANSMNGSTKLKVNKNIQAGDILTLTVKYEGYKWRGGGKNIDLPDIIITKSKGSYNVPIATNQAYKRKGVVTYEVIDEGWFTISILIPYDYMVGEREGSEVISLNDTWNSLSKFELLLTDKFNEFTAVYIAGIKIEKDVYKKVAIDRNGGIGKPNALSVKPGDNYSRLPKAFKEGYKLEGWYTSADFAKGTKIGNNAIVPEVDEHIIYAKWTPKQAMVNFNIGYADEDECNIGKIEVTFDSAYDILPEIERIGYEFLGWFIDDFEIKADTIVKIATDHTLTAKWK